MKKLLHQSVSVSLALSLSCATALAGYSENSSHRRDDLPGKAGEELASESRAIPHGLEKDMDIKRVKNAAEEARMRRFIDQHVAPEDVEKTFFTEYGDEIDCVKIHRQPALKHRKMKEYKIATPPGQLKRMDGPTEAPLTDTPDESTDDTLASMTTAETCDKGTVPIMRLKMANMKRFETLEEFRKKIPSHLKGKESAVEAPRDGASSLHQYATAYQYVNNHGAQTVLNLWNPYTERSNEFSLSQMWVVRGTGSSRETIEAGWQKYRDLYGDWYARLFIYFTPDNYGSRGCYNLTCSGFVQINNSVIIGGKYSSYSSLGGDQKTITLRWQKGGSNNAWWLKHGSTWVGYYPQSLFDSNGLRYYGARVSFGGEIIDRQPGGRHTYTDMGSGRWPYEGYRYAAYQRSIKYITTSNYWATPSLTRNVPDRWCYDLALKSSTGSWGKYFYFGGSGYNIYCK
jgi:hypothetical protein